MTHAEFEMELVEALNMLLEDERASVEIEVALASGATEYRERDALTTMGKEDIHFCEQLRTEMELAGLPVSPQINGIVFQVVGAERYDDRLRAFAHHQRMVADNARELQESNLEGALRDALEDITVTHARHTEWIERRANDFAATRTLEFGPTGRIDASRVVPGADDEVSGPETTLKMLSDEPPATPDVDAELETPVALPSVLSDVESGEQPEEPAAPPVRVPRGRRTAAAPAAPSTPKARAKAATTAKSVATPRAKSKSTTTTTTTTAPRRTRRPAGAENTTESATGE
jgi:hypothetical protein